MMLGFQLKARYGVQDSTKSCHSTCQGPKYEEVHGIDLRVGMLYMEGFVGMLLPAPHLERLWSHSVDFLILGEFSNFNFNFQLFNAFLVPHLEYLCLKW